MDEAGRRFHFKRCLGSGGFGEVYLATMTSASGVQTDVAVKMLHQGLDPRSQAVQRLRDEARLLGALNHPSILKVHDLVLLDGRIALVMEYIAGLDLEQCVELPEPIGLRAGLEATALVADALHTAFHSPGPDGTPLRLVHRDIKPPNIRIGRHGEVKVLDFGIAKAADARREAKTQTSVMIGSPWYMAPERFDGKNDSAAADVYALGCSLYEVAARGGRLFGELSPRDHFLLAMDPKRHDTHVQQHLAPLPVSPEVRWLLHQTLAFHPDDRPNTAELSQRAEALAEAQGGPSLRRWCKALTWPPPPSLDGPLIGREVTEARFSAIAATTPSLPRPSAATFYPDEPDPRPPPSRATPDDVPPAAGSSSAAPTFYPDEDEAPTGSPLPPQLPTPTFDTLEGASADARESASVAPPPRVVSSDATRRTTAATRRTTAARPARRQSRSPHPLTVAVFVLTSLFILLGLPLLFLLVCLGL